MKPSFSRLLISLAALSFLAGCGQGPGTGSPTASDRASAVAGKLRFHQKGGSLTYEVTVSDGVVTAGMQHFANPQEPVANIVGGWFDSQSGRLCLLIQGGKVLDEKWRSQAQHFHVDRAKKEITLEHTLYGYGQQLDASMMTAHELDEIDP